MGQTGPDAGCPAAPGPVGWLQSSLGPQRSPEGPAAPESTRGRVSVGVGVKT